MSNIKHTYEYVKQYIESFDGYILLSEEYKNRRFDKLKIQCPDSHIFEMLLSNFMQGRRCNHPSHNKRRLGYSEVKKYIIDEGFELLSTEYKNAKELLTIKCNKGHIFTKSFNNFKYEGQRCGECRDRNSSKYVDYKNPHFVGAILTQIPLILGFYGKNKSTRALSTHLLLI